MLKFKCAVVHHVPMNSFKEEFTNSGIICHYSICIGRRKGQFLKEFTEGDSYTPECLPKHMMVSCEVVNITKTFKKVPYKQVHPVEYTQDFRFAKISVYTPYTTIVSIPEMHRKNRKLINKYIDECTIK